MAAEHPDLNFFFFKKSPKKNWTKIWKKKKIITEPSPRQAKLMASPTEQTHPRILKKKKKNQHRELEIKLTHRTHDHVAGRESRENQSPIHWYSLYRAKAKKTKTNTVFIKKKKKKNP